jgi:hypothetical protein
MLPRAKVITTVGGVDRIDPPSLIDSGRHILALNGFPRAGSLEDGAKGPSRLIRTALSGETPRSGRPVGVPSRSRGGNHAS